MTEPSPFGNITPASRCALASLTTHCAGGVGHAIDEIILAQFAGVEGDQVSRTYTRADSCVRLAVLDQDCDFDLGEDGTPCFLLLQGQRDVEGSPHRLSCRGRTINVRGRTINVRGRVINVRIDRLVGCKRVGDLEMK